MKKYRVDTFEGTEHVKRIFSTEAEARAAAQAEKKTGKAVFLLEEIGNSGFYDVLEEV